MVNANSNGMLKQNQKFISFFIVVIISYAINKSFFSSRQTNFTTSKVSSQSVSSIIYSSLNDLKLDGNISFQNIEHAAKDFGNKFHFMPLAVLYPKSVSDISSTIKLIFGMGNSSNITVAAKGRGHSVDGQAQAQGGVVINMESLQEPKMHFHTGESPYVDVSGGELWINILQESLKHGLAPKSWTDYLYLTVGGTLSNAGISGQAFKHGPQISNVYQMEIVTGKGDVVTCSDEQNSDLFEAVLGGLGQFGIITRARIPLEPAPTMVKWIKVLYSDFSIFAKDQENLISAENSPDYLEGYVVINRTGFLNGWRSSFNFDPQDPEQASQFKTEGRLLFCLEIVKYFKPEDRDNMNQFIEDTLSELNNIPSTVFQSEVSFVEFLDRVRVHEMKLQEKGLWEIPHPWLHLLISRSKIHELVEEVFKNIFTDSSNGPILIYPLNKSKWRSTSMVIPEEEVFYVIGFLTSATPSSTGKDGLEYILNQYTRILNFCERAHIEEKQYLAYYSTQEEWKAHFGDQWEVFSRRKSRL